MLSLRLFDDKIVMTNDLGYARPDKERKNKKQRQAEKKSTSLKKIYES